MLTDPLTFVKQFPSAPQIQYNLPFNSWWIRRSIPNIAVAGSPPQGFRRRRGRRMIGRRRAAGIGLTVRVEMTRSIERNLLGRPGNREKTT